MIGIGYGSQMSAAMSARPAAATPSTRSVTTSRMNGRSRSAERGENDLATRRRSRVCTSPSADRIDTRRLSRKSRSVIPIISGIFEVALCQRLSRSTATTSAYCSTVYPIALRTIQWSGASDATSACRSPSVSSGASIDGRSRSETAVGVVGDMTSP